MASKQKPEGTQSQAQLQGLSDQNDGDQKPAIPRQSTQQKLGQNNKARASVTYEVIPSPENVRKGYVPSGGKFKKRTNEKSKTTITGASARSGNNQTSQIASPDIKEKQSSSSSSSGDNQTLQISQIQMDHLDYQTSQFKSELPEEFLDAPKYLNQKQLKFLQRYQSGIKCVLHQDNYTQFCIKSTCNIPVCQQCLPQHNEEHQKEGTLPQYEQLNSVIQNLIDTVQIEVQLLSNGIYDVNNNLQGIEFMGLQTLQQVKELKNKTLNTIKSYFNQLKNDIKYKIQKNKETLIRESDNLARMLKTRWESHIQTVELLKGPDNLKYTFPILGSSILEDNQLYYEALNQLNKKLQSSLPRISNHPQFETFLNTTLQLVKSEGDLITESKFQELPDPEISKTKNPKTKKSIFINQKVQLIYISSFQ